MSEKFIIKIHEISFDKTMITIIKIQLSFDKTMVLFYNKDRSILTQLNSTKAFIQQTRIDRDFKQYWLVTIDNDGILTLLNQIEDQEW